MVHLTKVVLFLAKQRFDAGSLSYSPESEFLGASSQLFLWRFGKQTVEGGEGKQSEKESLTANGEIDKNDYNIQIHFVRCSCFFIIDIRLL